MNADQVSKMFDMLLNGLTRDQILKYVRSEKNKLQITEEDIPALIAAAEARLAEFSQYEYQTELGRILKRYDDLYQRSYAINDFKACAQIERMRAEVLAKNRRSNEIPSHSETTPANRPGCDPRLFDPAPVATVARELNVSVKTLQRWVKAEDPKWQPQMPHVMRQRAIFVAPIVAYEHLQKYSARIGDLRPPAGYVEPMDGARAMVAQATEAANLVGIESPRDFLLSFITGKRTASPAEINALVNVVNSLTRAVEVEAKTARRYDVRDLLEVAEDLRDAVIKYAGPFTIRTSTRLRTLLAYYFGVDLSSYANAQSIIQNALVDEFEGLAVWLREHVHKQMITIEAKDTQ